MRAELRYPETLEKLELDDPRRNIVRVLFGKVILRCASSQVRADTDTEKVTEEFSVPPLQDRSPQKPIPKGHYEDITGDVPGDGETEAFLPDQPEPGSHAARADGRSAFPDDLTYVPSVPAAPRGRSRSNSPRRRTSTAASSSTAVRGTMHGDQPLRPRLLRLCRRQNRNPPLAIRTSSTK